MASNNTSNPVKPTILAFHGSGSNGLCHNVQLARLNRFCKDHVNIENVTGPFESPAGPGILPFFDDCGPFYRWLPPSATLSTADMLAGKSSPTMHPSVESLIRSTVTRIRATGSRVIGLIGFSQGTRVVAGLLLATQLRRAYGIEGEDWCDFDFGVCVCGSYPPPLIPASITALVPERVDPVGEKVRLPTMHVLGLKDEWSWAGKALVEKHFEEGEGKSTVREWDMGHHYPTRVEESREVWEWMEGCMGRMGGER